jgi:CheY-like chemotaxis protein
MDAFTLLSGGAPSAIVLALDSEGESGIELVCRFRQIGCNLPIIGICRARTTTDHVSALAAGADVCLTLPVDGRVLRLTISNSVCRAKSSKRLDLPEPRTAPVTVNTQCTADLNVLHARLVREVLYSRERNSPFVLVTLRVPPDARLVNELAAQVGALLRPADILFVGERGVACVLADSPTAEPFLTTFWSCWQAEAMPQLNRLRFDRQERFLDAARDLILQEVGEPHESGWMSGYQRAEGAAAVSELRPGDFKTYAMKAGYSHD